MHRLARSYDHATRRAHTHIKGQPMKAIAATITLIAASAVLMSTASAKVFASFEGSNAHNMWPVLLTDEPCRDGHPEIPGKRAMLLTQGNTRVEACWNYESDGHVKDGAIAVCQKKGGTRDGLVVNGYGHCYDIPKSSFIDPSSLPRSAF